MTPLRLLLLVTLLATILCGDMAVSKVFFYYLCGHEAGITVFDKPQKSASVLLDDGSGGGCTSRCVELLGKSRVPFVESEATPAATLDPYRLTSKPGKYRFYLS